MKRIILLMLISVTLFAIPAKKTPTFVTQPDGSTFLIVGFGDEHYNFAETIDGYVVVQGADKFWYYATIGNDGKFIATSVVVKVNNGFSIIPSDLNVQRHLRETKQVINSKLRVYDQATLKLGTVLRKGVNQIKKTGTTTLQQLVLCVKFSDLENTFTSKSFQDMINLDSWRDGIGGMNTYYKEVSYNSLNVQADYQDWITAAHPSSYYAENNAEYWTHIDELIKQCIDAAHTHGVNFANYDNDGDGVVDGVFIVHAGKGAEEGNDLNYIWSHQGSISDTYPALTYDGMKFDKYITLPEMFFSNHVEIGVFCHEFGHMLGLPDTYDTDGETNGSSEGLGNWCLMATGSWGGNGYSPERPVHMSAYCKALLGFTTPTELTSSQSISIPAAETNSTSYKIWMDANQSDEYMLIENRQQTGFDTNLYNSGLLIYHIDKNLTDIWPASNDINVTNTRIGIKLYEADGLEELETAVNRGNSGDPYPGSTSNTSLTGSTTPNSKLWDNSSSGVEVNNISASASTMTADVVVPIYTGYSQQFYRKIEGWANTDTYRYGMVKCTPTYTGKLLGVRVFNSSYHNLTLTASAYSTLSGETMTISGLLGTTSSSSSSVYNFVQLNFSPSINVTQNVPIYISIAFQPASGYYLPVDITASATGNSYVSADGTSFERLDFYDIPVRVVLHSDSPSPVELNSFTASANYGSVLFNWGTVTEVNNYGFDLERSNDNSTWKKVAFINGYGNSNSPKNYTYTDKPNGGLKYSYRLKQIDFVGRYKYYTPIDVVLATSNKFIVNQNFPNPFNPETTINYQIPEAGIVTLKVFDILGREVVTLVNEFLPAGFHNATFNAKSNSLASGFYFYKVQIGNYSQIKKMLLLK